MSMFVAAIMALEAASWGASPASPDGSAPPAPAIAPVEVPHPPVPGDPPAEHADPPGLIVLGASGAFGRASENPLSPYAIGGGELTARLQLPNDLTVDGDVELEHSHPTYLLGLPSADASPVSALAVGETSHDVRVGATWNAIPRLSDGLAAHLSTRVALGVVEAGVRNLVTPVDLVALRFGGEVTARPLTDLRLRVAAGYAPALGGTGHTLSVEGLPKALSDVSATLFVDGGADRRYGAAAGWRLDAMTFDHSLRVRQTATLGFFVTFG